MNKVLMAALLLVLSATLVMAQSHTLVVLCHEDHMVYELDMTTGKVLHMFEAPNQPHEAAVSPDGKTVYAAIPQDAFVEILDGVTFKEKGRIETELFKRPPQVRAARGGATGAAAGPPNTSASPHGMSLNNDGGKLYIGIENAEIPGVIVYDTKTGKVLHKIDTVLEGGHYLQVQPVTDKLYYPKRTDNRVVVIDTKTDRITKIIPVQGGPVGVGFAPNGDVWIHGDGDGKLQGVVTVIDSRKDEVKKVIQTSGLGAGRMAVSPDGKWAASTHGTTEDVAIFDAAKMEVVATVKIGKGPGFPVFSPDSSKLYTMNYGENNVTVIDLAKMAVTAAYPVGKGPFGGSIRFPNGKP